MKEFAHEHPWMTFFLGLSVIHGTTAIVLALTDRPGVKPRKPLDLLRPKPGVPAAAYSRNAPSPVAGWGHGEMPVPYGRGRYQAWNGMGTDWNPSLAPWMHPASPYSWPWWERANPSNAPGFG